MELWDAPRRRRFAMMARLLVGLLPACAPTFARNGDLVRITPGQGDQIQGSLVGWGPDSFAIHGGSAVSEIRSQDATRAAIFGAIAGVGGWMCLRSHSWVRARLPDLPNPQSALPGSVSPGR
jgi:hypothetical protein